MPIKQFFVEIIRNEKNTFIAKVLTPLLSLLSYGFATVSSLRSYLYDKGYLKIYSADIPVISVGNIVAGGTGKTPYVISLAKKLKEKEKIAILLRGFSGDNEKTGNPLIVTSNTTAKLAGDEAVLIKRHLQDDMVIVSRDRVKGACLAKKLGASLVILDDGFQHRRLKRIKDFVIVDSLNPFGFNYFLPRGFLRESPKALRRADKIIINGCPSKQLEMEIRKYTTAPIEYIHNEVSGLYDCEDKSVSLLSFGNKVAVFCAIGNPERFLNTVKELKLEVIATYKELDHRLPQEEKLKLFAEHAKKLGATCILCTEKDRVKIKGQINLALPLLWVGITCKGD